MDSNLIDKNSKYVNVLKRIRKKNSNYEGFLLIKKYYLTNNLFYYVLCILFHFIHLISISGNFSNIFIKKNKSNSFQEFFKILTIYKLLQNFQISFLVYGLINSIFIIIFIYRITENAYKYKIYKNTQKWTLPNKFEIIITHILFLLFPYIIEYLSFSYYIFFFPNKFVVKAKSKDMAFLIIMIIINTILIIELNIENYIDLICCNKIYTITIFDVYSSLLQKDIKKNISISYKCSNLSIYILIFFQNFALISTLENYLNGYFIVVFKCILSITILLTILILFLGNIKEYNYTNFINNFVNIIILFCFYSVLFDIIIFFLKYRINKVINQIIYEIIKLLTSYITNSLFIIKRNNFFISELTHILFQEKNMKKEEISISSFYYCHQIMLNIKEYNDIQSILLLMKIFCKHINKCNKIICNCHIFKNFIGNQKNDFMNKEKLKDSEELLFIINYYFEIAFFERNFYDNYDLAILLAEHFCHLKNNPIISFSIISTLILKNRNKLSKIKLIVLYELCQKYIYFLSSKIRNEIELEREEEKKFNKLYLNPKREEEFCKYYKNLHLSNKVKQLINNYIINMMRILKYKISFEDSLSFKYDENNENIIFVKINFFNKTINNDYNINNKNKSKLKNSNNNLYYIIDLLKNNQLFYNKIINSINKIDVIKGIPSFMIFKFFLFYDILGTGKIPKEANNLYSFMSNHINSNNNEITKNEYAILKKRYNEENNKIDSKIYAIFEFKIGLKTKYFSEDGALKLGYKQIDIINKKMDILLQKEFANSHLNTIKQLIINNQIRHNITKQFYFFDKSSTILYSSKFEFVLIYNISNNLILMLESNFIYENEYRFMLNNNFELLANSINFEDEYFLNKKIFQAYNINLLDILKIKPEKLNKIFQKEFKIIQYQKMIRQIKTEDFFISYLYNTSGENIGIMTKKYFINSKNNILSIIENLNNKENTKEENDEYENKNLIQKDSNKNIIKNLFDNNNEKVILHKSYYITLNKGEFIKNLAKELIKIPDNDIMIENDKFKYNLILSSKKLISNLLTKKELSNNYIRIEIKLSFYYDKPFYFITINDPKKICLTIYKSIHFGNDTNKLIIKKTTKPNNNNNKNKIPFNKNNRKSRNKVTDKKNINILNIRKKINNDKNDKKIYIMNIMKKRNYYKK